VYIEDDDGECESVPGYGATLVETPKGEGDPSGN
jgi:hypothetical protein